MSLDTKVKNLIINTNMTKEQYEAIDDKSNQLFFVEDSSVIDVPAPEENQSGYLHTDGANLTWKEIESGDKLPDQTDNAGKFLMTDGTEPSWGEALVNRDTSKTHGITIGTLGTTDSSYVTSIGGGNVVAGSSSVNVGYDTKTTRRSVAIGSSAEAMVTNGGLSDHSIAIGLAAKATASRSIQLGTGTNSQANTFSVSNANGNFEIMSADGTIPTDRYTTTPTDAGTYVPKLTIAEDGTATREWSTESGGESLPDQTDNAGKFLTTDGTTASWSEALTNNSTKLFATAVGSFSSATAGGSAFGYSAIAGYTNSVAIGYSAKAQATNAIQLGQGTNSDEQTFKVANANGNFEIMDVQGNIPLDRLTYVTDQIGDISTALTSILGE